ncbi:MAG: hypothetical protein IH968_13105 [Gemmatimonadetes bacterium]|nr:hypothetical protein [Gemmatimonadota bacterium]
MSGIDFKARPWIGKTAMVSLFMLVGLSSCDFLDPTRVENPRTTVEDLAQAEEPTKSLLPGLRVKFAQTIRSIVVTAENVSDNYSIHGTGLRKTLDDPSSLTPSNMNSTSSFGGGGIYNTVQSLRALSDFVIDVIVPEDQNSTTDQVAEASYYRGMAYLIMAETFTAVPVEPDGLPLPASELLTRAITDLTTANAGALAVQSRAALARAYRWQGDSGQAESFASSALAQDADFVIQQEYDATSFSNSPYSYLVSRALQEMQPLPRLDFLDPKYLDREAGIAFAKAEEMHLILAEIDLAAGAMAAGRAHLVDAINMAISRGTVAFQDDDPRSNEDLSIRPRDASIVIRADANSPFIAGLVLDRPASIQAPTVSATSLDPAVVAGLTDMDDVWHAFHLARQEILFLEGRRMADLGIKLPIMLREIDANPNINPGDLGTTVFVPSYIPVADEMDLFTPKTLYDGGLLDPEQILTGTEVTMNVDMNRVLTVNRVTPF